jgi:hypothetical protein
MRRRNVTASSSATSTPSMLTEPEVGVTILLTERMAVVLPDPDNPINTVILAVGTVNEKSFSATVSPYRFETRSNWIIGQIESLGKLRERQARVTSTPRQKAT